VKNITPTSLYELVMKKITKNQKIAFLSTFIIGILCHLFILTNSMFNTDDIRYWYVNFDKPELGRWLQTYFAGISSYFSLPVVNGVLGIFYLSLAAMVLVALYDLENRLIIMLISALLVVFPAVTCILSYTFTFDAFMLSCFLSVCSAYYIARKKCKKSVLLGAAFLCVSVAIYQSYLPFTLLLLLLYFLLEIVSGENSDRDLIVLGIRYLLGLGLGMGAYFVGMKLTLKIKGIELSDYQGIGESSVAGIGQIKNRILRALIDFVDFFRSDQMMCFNTWMKIATLLSALLIFVLFAALFVANKSYRSIFRWFLTVFCLACIPVAAGIMFIISDGVYYHALMRHMWVIFFFAVGIIYEKARPVLDRADKKQILEPLVQWLVILSLLLSAWNYILIDNVGYFNMNFRYEKTYQLATRIMAEARAVEGYDYDYPMAIIGRYSKTYQMDALKDTLGDMMAGVGGPRIFGGDTRNWVPFIQNCLGEDIVGVSPEEEDAISQSEAFEAMPRFPHEGSIAVIDDVVVVKLND